MRPKTTSFKKKEAVRRKNHEHWSTHKYKILEKRNLQSLKLEQLQILSSNEGEMKDLAVDDAFNDLSINKTTNDVNTELFDDDLNEVFMDKYAAEVDEDGIAFYDAFDDFHQDIYEDENYEEREDVEETLTDEQMEFANGFINMETSAMPLREYDELVSKKVLNICYIDSSVAGYFSYTGNDKEKT